MGEVWLARQETPFRRRVAVKVIRPGLDSVRVLRRFQAERQALALMDHQNIARVFDAGRSERGRPYFVMEYVPGLALTRHCDRQRLPVPARLELFLQVCDGVQHAHRKGILHRDLKPANLLVQVRRDRAVPKVIDFGVARAMEGMPDRVGGDTTCGEMVGTPAYMSPEQAAVDPVDLDTRTDVYSLGVVLYELLCGTPAFPCRGQRITPEWVRRSRESEPPRPSRVLQTDNERIRAVARRRGASPRSLAREVRGDLDWIVARAIEPDRERRYGSVAELAADVRRHLQHQPVVAGPPRRTYRMRKFARRHRLAVGVVCVVGVVLMGLTAGLAGLAQRLGQERDRAHREATAASRTADFLVGIFESAHPSGGGGSTEEARRLLDAGAHRIGWELGSQPGIRSRLLGSMARAYLAMGQPDAAEPLLRRALDPPPAEAAPRAQILHDLADLHHERGEFAPADSLYRRAVALRTAALGAEHPLVAVSLRRRAGLLRLRGEWEEAEALLRRTLETFRVARGPRHPEVARTLSDLSVLLWHRGRRSEAETAIREALAIRRERYAPDHPDIGESLNNLGALAYQDGRFAPADSLYALALGIRERALAPHHPDVAQTLHNIGASFLRQGRYAEAEAAVRRALEIHRGFGGPRHHLVAHSLQTLGVIQRDRGDTDRARATLREVLERREDLFGPLHPKVGVTLLVLGKLEWQAERSGPAQAYLARAVEVLEETVGPEHPHVREAREFLARARS